MVELESLPDEMLQHLMTFMPTEDLISMGQAGSNRLLAIAREVVLERPAAFWIDFRKMPGRGAVMGAPVPRPIKAFFGRILRRVNFVGALHHIDGKYNTMHPRGFSDFQQVLRPIMCELVHVLCNKTLGIRRISKLHEFINCLTVSSDNYIAIIAALCVANHDTLLYVENGHVEWHDHFLLYDMPKLREITFNVTREDTSPLSGFTFSVLLTQKLKLFSMLCPDLNQLKVVVRNCTERLTGDFGAFVLKNTHHLYINLYSYRFERQGWAEGALPPP